MVAIFIFFIKAKVCIIKVKIYFCTIDTHFILVQVTYPKPVVFDNLDAQIFEIVKIPFSILTNSPMVVTWYILFMKFSISSFTLNNYISLLRYSIL